MLLLPLNTHSLSLSFTLTYTHTQHSRTITSLPVLFEASFARALVGTFCVHAVCFSLGADLLVTGDLTFVVVNTSTPALPLVSLTTKTCVPSLVVKATLTS